MRRVFSMTASIMLAFIVLLMLAPGVALASGNPARSETIAAGTYIIAVNLFQDPPYVDQSFDVTIVPQDHSLRLSGQVIAQPGLGTDATALHYALTPTGDNIGTLKASVRIPVKGAWNLQVQLNGPQGNGTGNVAVTASAPGAMPSWLAWIIGSSPLVFVAFWVWMQHRYRQKLVLQQATQA